MVLVCFLNLLYENVFPSRKAKVEEIVKRLSPESKKDEVSVCTFSEMKFDWDVDCNPAVQVCFVQCRRIKKKKKKRRKEKGYFL